MFFFATKRELKSLLGHLSLQPFNLILKNNLIFTLQLSERKFNIVLFYFSGFSSPSHWTVHVCSKNTYQEKMVSVNIIILCIIVASKNVGVLMAAFSWLVTNKFLNVTERASLYCSAEFHKGL